MNIILIKIHTVATFSIITELATIYVGIKIGTQSSLDYPIGNSTY